MNGRNKSPISKTKAAVGDHIFGYREEALPDDLNIGVTAAEGINRLYDFSIR